METVAAAPDPLCVLEGDVKVIYTRGGPWVFFLSFSSFLLLLLRTQVEESPPFSFSSPPLPPPPRLRVCIMQWSCCIVSFLSFLPSPFLLYLYCKGVSRKVFSWNEPTGNLSPFLFFYLRDFFLSTDNYHSAQLKGGGPDLRQQLLKPNAFFFFLSF